MANPNDSIIPPQYHLNTSTSWTGDSIREFITNTPQITMDTSKYYTFTKRYYRWIVSGECPHCGAPVFRRQYSDTDPPLFSPDGPWMSEPEGPNGTSYACDCRFLTGYRVPEGGFPVPVWPELGPGWFRRLSRLFFGFES